MLYDGVSPLRIVIGIEEERVVVDAEPRVLVAEVPEGDVVNYVGVFAEYLENLIVLVFLEHFLEVCHLCCTLVETQSAAHILVDAYVQLCNVYVVHYLGISADGGIHVCRARSVNIVVPLHSYSVDRYSCFLHLLDHIVDSLALGRISLIVIVVEQKCVRVRLTGIFESLGDEFFACDLIERGVSVRGCSRPSLLVRHSLVHDIPAVNYVLVAGYNSIDVALHIGIELILGEEFSLFILIDPLAYLAVPYQAVSTELDAIAAAEISNLVGIFPIIDAFLRLG